MTTLVAQAWFVGSVLQEMQMVAPVERVKEPLLHGEQTTASWTVEKVPMGHPGHDVEAELEE